MELKKDIIMSLVLGLLQAVTTDMYGVLLPAEKPVLEENRLRSLLADSRQEINQQEGEQEKGDNASCDIHSFGFQCSRKGFSVKGSFLLKRPFGENIFLIRLQERFFRYAIVCLRNLL